MTFTEPLPVFRSFVELEYAPKPSTVLRLGSSMLFHISVAGIVLLISGYRAGIVSMPIPGPHEEVVRLQFSPFSLQRGGGGGGGGKNQPKPASRGALPPATPHQLAPPSVSPPDLKPVETQMKILSSIQTPLPIPPQLLGHYGVSAGSLTDLSDGAGRGGGIGAGTGTGVGTGTGPGAGSGSRGGIGSGPDGGVGDERGPFTAGAGHVSHPQIIRAPLPHYTDAAIKAKIQGVVVLQVIIRRDGAVDAPRVVRSLGYGLDEEAIRCVSRDWKFRPASRNGSPVDVYALIEITFHLH